ncbi:MAG: hypothetical protein ACREH3_14600, partial [Geminicoccales bacterium]
MWRGEKHGEDSLFSLALPRLRNDPGAPFCETLPEYRSSAHVTQETRTTDTAIIAHRTARGLWWASLAIAVAGLAISVLAGALVPDDAVVILYLATGALGVAIARRVPDNAVGWLLIATGLISALQTLATGIADIVLLEGLGPESLGVYAAMFSVASWPIITFLPLIPVLLLFPDGRPLSPRWRIALWLSVAGILGTSLGLLVLDDPDGAEASRWGMTNPMAIDAEASDTFLAVTFMLVIATLIAAAWSLLLRFRRSDATGRQRIKWVVFGGSLAVPLWIVGGALLDETVLGALLAAVALILIPMSIAMAILRYRLYDIDRLISRTVSYVLVAGLLA